MRRTASALLLAVLVTGCTSSSGPDLPEVEAFAEGTCRIAAPDVRTIGATIPRLGDRTSLSDDVKTDLREAQERLMALAEGAEPALKPELDALVQAIGAVRIRADGNSYDPELGEFLDKEYERVLEACGAGSAG